MDGLHAAAADEVCAAWLAVVGPLPRLQHEHFRPHHRFIQEVDIRERDLRAAVLRDDVRRVATRGSLSRVVTCTVRQAGRVDPRS